MIHNNKQDKKQELHATDAMIGGGVAMHTAAKTNEYNNECNAVRESLRAEAAENQSALNGMLQTDPGFVGYRSKGVSMAYKYEAADIKMGGNGSANWNKSQCSEIIERGGVRGAEGHHIENVANNPELQTNPDNIKFFKDRKSHLYEGHGGDFRNESHGPLIDKDKMLLKTNNKRVLKNEAKGALYAAGAGAAMGVIESVYDTCKKEGLNGKSVQKGLKNSAKPALVKAAVAGGSYLVSRGLSYLLKKL